MRFWHELGDKEFKIVLKKMTYGEVKRKYKQPDWCHYPEALMPLFGCWSLLGDRGKINLGFCKDCHEFKKN